MERVLETECVMLEDMDCEPVDDGDWLVEAEVLSNRLQTAMKLQLE